MALRFTNGDADRARTYAAELVALAPDVVLTSGASTVGSILQAIRTVPEPSIQSAPASSIAWRGRVRTPQVSRRMNTA
jgi:hypothetical protein